MDQKWLVLGCGVNLAHSPEETRITASMKEHAVLIPDAEKALEHYAAHLLPGSSDGSERDFSLSGKLGLIR